MILPRIHWLCPDCGNTLAITTPDETPSIPPICDRCGENLSSWPWYDLPITRRFHRVIPSGFERLGDLAGTLIDVHFPCDRCHAPCQGQDCFCEPCDGVFCAACYPIHLQAHDDAVFAAILATL